MPIKYLGSKRRLLGNLAAAFDKCSGEVFIDLFSGAGHVSTMLRRSGQVVRANDWNTYAATIARAYIESVPATMVAAEKVRKELRTAPPLDNWFSQKFSRDAKFWTTENGERIAGIRARIAELELEPDVEAVALCELLEAADRVDATCGQQAAFLKYYPPRALRPLELRELNVPSASPAGSVTQLEALEAAGALEGDVAYLDAPYNQHSYLANYHVWETLVLWDDPETYGVANKRAGVRDRRSKFNSRKTHEGHLAKVIEALKAPTVVVSRSNEAFTSAEALQSALSDRGNVVTFAFEHDRYIGHRIGIYSPDGHPVGTPSHSRNTEYIYVGGLRVDPVQLELELPG